MAGGDPLTIAVGATALAGVALALWGWRDIRDAFATRANARARLGLDGGKLAATRKTGGEGLRRAAASTRTNDIAHRDGGVTR